MRLVGVDAHIDPLRKGLMWASNPTALNRTNISRLSYVKYLPRRVFPYTKLNAPPEGRSVYGQGNDNTHNRTTCFSARQRYFRVPGALFFHIFSRKREKIWSPKARCGVTAKEALR